MQLELLIGRWSGYIRHGETSIGLNYITKPPRRRCARAGAPRGVAGGWLSLAMESVADLTSVMGAPLKISRDTK